MRFCLAIVTLCQTWNYAAAFIAPTRFQHQIIQRTKFSAISPPPSPPPAPTKTPAPPAATTPAPAPVSDIRPIDPKKDVYFRFQLDLEDALTFADRSMDTLEDAATHFKRSLEPVETASLGERNAATSTTGKRPRLVILGTGWGAHACSKVIDYGLYDIVVCSPRNHFVFTPLLAGVSVGTCEPSSVVESIKQSNPHVLYVQGKARAIDPANHKVKLDILTSRGEDAMVEQVELDYDKLVYAVGTKTGTFGIPGVRENCFFIKEVSDATNLRQALLQRFDEASFPGVTEERQRLLLSFVVVGSGPTGIEFVGELNDLLTNDIPTLFPALVGLVSLTVVSADKTILPMFEQVLQAKGLETLAKSGVDVKLNAKVVEVTKDSVVLKEGPAINFGLCVWAGGTEPRDLTKDLISMIPGQKDMEGAKRGMLTVDPYMRVKGVEDGSILALGDSTRIEGYSLPATGQVAAQEGAYVGRLLNRGYDLSRIVPSAPSIAKETEPLTNATTPASTEVSPFSLEYVGDFVRLRGALKAKPFHFINLGVLAYLGSGAGLAQIEGGDKSRILDASGKVGFFLWRSTYTVKQVSIRNRVCVLIDWMKAKAFGRNFAITSETKLGEK